VIELQQLTKHYGGRAVVDRLSLEVARGELLVLLGGSGSGKTTTLKMINRLVEPSAGRVLIDGEDVMSVPPAALRRRIGYAFQQVGLFPHMSVAENVGITPTLLGWDAARIATRVDTLLALVELDPATYRSRRPSELSGGQQQRVGVARALAAEPAVLLLDEPFGALDPLTRDRLQQSLAAIRTRLGVTIVFVTHDMVEALLLGDRIAVLREGTLVQLGTPAELLRRPADEYVAQLMETPLRHGRIVEALARSGARPVSTP
jgi:osmoprotectant transport system ATP-binding protein